MLTKSAIMLPPIEKNFEITSDHVFTISGVKKKKNFMFFSIN